MGHNMIVNAFSHLPMVWDFTIPMMVVGVWCVVLYWEGVHGHVTRHIKSTKTFRDLRNLGR